MKREFKDLDSDTKKEYIFLEAISLNIPYVFALTIFIAIMLISSNHYIGIGAFLINVALLVSYFFDKRELNKIYGVG